MAFCITASNLRLACSSVLGDEDVYVVCIALVMSVIARPSFKVVSIFDLVDSFWGVSSSMIVLSL